MWYGFKKGRLSNINKSKGRVLTDPALTCTTFVRVEQGNLVLMTGKPSEKKAMRLSEQMIACSA